MYRQWVILQGGGAWKGTPPPLPVSKTRHLYAVCDLPCVILQEGCLDTRHLSLKGTAYIYSVYPTEKGVPADGPARSLTTSEMRLHHVVEQARDGGGLCAWRCESQ